MQYKVFGCKVNKYYTDKWLNSDYLRDKSGTFVASCVVTDSAKRKWVRFVKKEVEQIEDQSKVYISGCGAFKDGKAQNDFFVLYPELAHAKDKIEILDEDPDDIDNSLDRIKNNIQLLPTGSHQNINLVKDNQGSKIKNNHKNSDSSPKKDEDTKIKKRAIDLSKLGKLKNTQIYTKKFILIQGGCDSFCTFCLTVQKRGRHFYRSAEDIAEEIQAFADNGGKEVVLTGVNLSAWGLDNTHDIQNFSPLIKKNGVSGGGSRFAELLNYLLENTTISRLRISSLGPEFIDDEVLEVFKNTRIYPHFHFSIQSGSSQTLKAMSRHYDGDYIRELLKKTLNVQREDEVSISIGADLIVGFPGESEEDFMDTYNLVKNYNITKLHAFPFSPHTKGESVPAGKFKNQLSDEIKKDRMQRLMEIGENVRNNFIASQKGKSFKVLIEKYNKALNTWSGWTENYIEANQDNFTITSGKIAKNSIIEGILT